MNKKKISIVIICLVVLGVGLFFWKRGTDSAPVIQHVVAEGMKTYSDHGFSIDHPQEVAPVEKEGAENILAINFGEDAIVDYISDSETYITSLKTYGQYTGIARANGYNFHIHEKTNSSGKNIVTYSLKAPTGGYVIYLSENSRMSLDTFFLK